MKNDKVKNNKSDLLSVLAITEDIQRTANQLYEKLRTLLGNPNDIDAVKQITKQLGIKVDTLKNIKLTLPFTETEEILIPHINDISPKTDPNYSQITESSAMLNPDAVISYDLNVEQPEVNDNELLPPDPMTLPPNPVPPPVSSRATLPEIEDLKNMGVEERQQYMEEHKERLLKQRQEEDGPKRLPQKGKKIDRPTPPKKQGRKRAQRPPKKFNDFKGLDDKQK
tara:strand:+ start:72 stop:746 length:675 start_codon:yes stop_codon:yes gene_type:complete